MSDKRMIAAKQKFYQQLDVNLSKKKIKRTKIPTEQEYNEICCVLESWKVGEKHSPLHANWYRNYTLLGNTSRSAALRWKKSKQDQNLKVATKEQMFVIIMEGHSALGHAKDPRKIYEEIGKTWYGITREDVELALSLCPTCFAAKTRITAKQMPLKMILSETIGKRAQMDLIDMTSQQDPDGFCWILRLIDHLSGFAAVRPLRKKSSEECGIAIIQILCSFPDFDILQSDNGGEFLGNTVKYVNEHFPETHIVRGRSRHPQSQGGVERSNGPFKTSLQCHMQENRTKYWAKKGIYIVNRRINHRTSFRVESSYEIMRRRKSVLASIKK